MHMTRKTITLVSIIIALGLLYPGVTQPVLTLSGTVEKSTIAELGIELIAGPGADSQTRQLLNTFSSFLGLDQIEGHVERLRSTALRSSLREHIYGLTGL